MTKILRGHFETTAIYHIETIEVAVASFEKIVISLLESFSADCTVLDLVSSDGQPERRRRKNAYL